jgi:two-component system nitrogen regulation response regulator GlnG
MSTLLPTTEKLAANDTPPEWPMRLRVVAGPDSGRELRLEKGNYSIGKDPSCDLVLTDGSVSRAHLKLSVMERGLRATDLQSTNGSFCNDLRIDSVEVGPGTRIRIGRTELLVQLAEEAGTSPPISSAQSFGLLRGDSIAMRRVFALLERVAASDCDVLVEGESGTGKDLCAQAIHSASQRAQGPLVVCDLSAVTASLFESELFGHVKGSFTGALAARSGAFERAHGGTLFLDEVGELPLELQPRLLRAIEQRKVKRVGGDEFQSVDVRVIAATNRDLTADVASGRFREDLYHRLAVIRVRLPPLRERLDDLPILIRELLAPLNREPSILGPSVHRLLREHSWPGNVRELRNVLQRTVTLGTVELPPKSGEVEAANLSGPFREAKERLILAFEREYLMDLMARNQGNLARAAREAQIDRVSLYRLIKRHQLSTDAVRSDAKSAPRRR